MARLWTCGFELQSTTANVEFTSLTGTASISTTIHRAGAAGLRCNPTAATGFIEHQVDTASAVKRTFHRLYLYVASLPAATTAIYAIGQSGFFPCHLRLSPTGTLQLYDASLAAPVGAASTTLTTGRWYRIGIDHTDGAAGTAIVSAYLDGVQFGTGSVTVINGFSRIRAGVITPSTTADIYLDDIAVNDTSGSAQTGLPGSGSVVHLYPSSAGDANDFATAVGGTAGAANNYTRVDETTPDDATTYNETSLSGTTTTDDFNLASAASAGIASTDSITLVAVGARVGSNATTTASLVYRLKSQAAGTLLESSSVSVAVNGWASHKASAPFIHQLTSYTDPQTGAVWTPSRLDTAQIGYRANVSQTTVRRVSTVWALVEFVPTAAVLLETLTDDFSSPTVDTAKWPDNYNEAPGGALPDQPDGRARVPCNPGFAAYASDNIYALADSHIHVQAVPPAVGGSTGSVFCQLLVLSSVAGTQIVFEIDVATNLLLMTVHVDFTDEGGASIPYNAVDHAWLRIRESAGVLYWETSPDGRAWTVRHTDTSPAWVADGNLQAQLLAYRDNGTNDYAYFDNVNLRPTLADGYTVAIDWDGDGDYTGPHENVTADVLARDPVVFQYGRDQARALSPPRVGSIGFTLCNADRVFSPENPDSPISNDIAPAAPIKVSEVIDDTLYPLITGRIDTFDVKTDRGDRSAAITGLDGLALLRGVKISTELHQAQRTGALIAVILDAVGWTAPRDLDPGATHVPWWWASQDDAFDLLTDLLASEGPPSIAYVAPDGTFIYRDRHHRLLRYPSLVSQATFIAPKETCLTAQAIPGPPELLRVSDTSGVLATLTVGAKSVAMRGPTRTFRENKKPFTDTFDRTVASGFGSSGGGGNYSVTGTASDFSVNGSVGVASLPTANASRFATILDNMTDVDVTATVTLPAAPTGASSSVGLVFGYTDVDNNNRARLIVTTAGAVQLALEKEVADVTTTLGAATQVGTGFVGGDLWHIRAQRTGTTIRCRAWKDSTDEPTTWLHSVTDTSNPSGRVGFRFLASTGSTSLPRLFHTHSIQVISGSWPTIPTVTHNTWVRVLDEPFDGRWTNQIADQILRWTIDPSPDVLAYAMKYINGAPAITNPTLGAQVTGQASYGPLAADGTRIEGADFHDYLGVDWVFVSGEERTADPDELTSLDCSGFVRMIFGYQMGLPMVFNEDIDGINLPRRTLDIGPSGPGVIVAQAAGTAPSLAAIQIGDVPHFDATSDGESTGQVDHNGIYIGTDQNGLMRFVNSRKTPNGPTMGDLGGASVLNGSGTYTTSLRIIRRF